MNDNIDECPFNIGKAISDFLTDNRISTETAAAKSGIELEKFREILGEKSTDTETITKISIALDHNFMTDIANIVEEELRGC